MCIGHPSPVASTGMSSYLSKFIPTPTSPNSSLHHSRSINIRGATDPEFCYPAGFVPNPDMSDPAGSESEPDPNHLDPAGSGSKPDPYHRDLNLV